MQIIRELCTLTYFSSFIFQRRWVYFWVKHWFVCYLQISEFSNFLEFFEMFLNLFQLEVLKVDL